MFTVSMVNDACASSPCKHAATCTNTALGYLCNCPPGVTGLNCQYGMLSISLVIKVCYLNH